MRIPHVSSRRGFLQRAALCGGIACLPGLGGTIRGEDGPSASPAGTSTLKGRIYKTLKWGMVDLPELSTAAKFTVLREVGFDGVELDSPGGLDKKDALAASRETGFPIDGTVDSTHWQIRLTDAKEETRAKGLADLITAIQETHAVGGHTVLLVPGHGDDGPREEIWERSLTQIRQALPIAARLGVYIAIENVWNKMFYDDKGPNTQTADELARFIDVLDSPWAGVQFDIGNHQRFGSPAAWIRTLGNRIVKLDVKDWGVKPGFCKIGEGDVDWPEVRKALLDINYSGWAAAEVEGGNREALADVSRRMDRVLGLE